LKHLEDLRNQITLLYGNGKLSEANYEILRDKISDYINKHLARKEMFSFVPKSRSSVFSAI
jgi:hypothetical protein